ncbi:hypothetical protein Sgly_2504 [Syntrophobotulus glycolicus DSM 8271]|uniref:Putative heavy-metal chelation domain-containing protein n=1 Tax=Syntrophobotulus glycolicus (strain DSM 8271 / FlGlyR) TaxID=645991 RepID=F0SW04_SYNGF|nr:DUF364 domain-containing protein [Syntrophobotulus glycolicus]ADY56788.1 hypothetical protein Sgly_2504 [Syntrophobotulus glycolicus DSM 8271]
MEEKQTEFILLKLQRALKELADKNGLNEEIVEVTCSVLTLQEAIGNPERDDFPIQKGKEKMMQACFGCSCGQAFTDMSNTYSGKLKELATMPLETNFERAVFISALNAVMRELKMTDRTIHCKDEGPKKCSLELVEMIEKEYGNPKIALFGLQPAMSEVLSEKYSLRIFDLDQDNIGKEKFGIVVEDGICDLEEVQTWADLFLVTGSTLCNKSIVNFLPIKKPVVYFGITIAGTASLLGLKRFCPQAS